MLLLRRCQNLPLKSTLFRSNNLIRNYQRSLIEVNNYVYRRPFASLSSGIILNTECSTSQRVLFSLSQSAWIKLRLKKNSSIRQQESKSLNFKQERLLSSSNASYEGSEIYEEVAHLIKSSSSNIMVMCGAGISTPSGIPDFRSPSTGLYHNLQKYNLPYPEAIFDIHYFMMDPRPFFTLARDLYPGVNYKPNIVHYFMRLILEKEKLQKVYTQNIDGLERMAGIPEDKLMEAHGTFARASCTLCGKMHSSDKVKSAVLDGEIPMCEEKKCKGKVKPDIVFFGENLPEHFWNYHLETHFTDLLIVIGTSLEVYPFAGIAEAVGHSTPRVLINRDPVGSFGTRPNDYMLLGDLEEVLKRLANALEWMSELENLQRTV